MKKGMALLVAPLALWGQMAVTATERTVVELSPDVLRGSLGFEEQHRNPDSIKEHFNAIVAALKRFDPEAKVCRGGGYRLYPRYSYKDGKQAFLGYGGSLSFACEYAAIEQHHALEKAVEKASAPEVRRSQGALEWGVSAGKREEAERELRLALLRKAALQAGSFSAQTGLECGVEKVDFTPAQRPGPIMARAMAAESVPTQSPLRADEEISVEATVGYRCAKRTP